MEDHQTREKIKKISLINPRIIAKQLKNVKKNQFFITFQRK
jgi:hypothetical protein